MIDDLSLHIRPGEKIGLVGRSGAGKSTIVNLLLRFYDAERGRILIDGQDIALVTQDTLRAQIGMVTQDTSLLHRSVRDNILYGRPDATDDDMIAAARRAPRRTTSSRPRRPQGPHRLRRARRRARRQALRRPAPAHRDRARDAEGRADPAARRGDQRARLRGRGGDPAEPLPADGGQDRRRDRAPPVDDRRDGPADRARPRPHRRGGRPPQPARAGRPLRAAVGRTRAAGSSARRTHRRRRASRRAARRGPARAETATTRPTLRPPRVRATLPNRPGSSRHGSATTGWSAPSLRRRARAAE